MDHRLAPGLLMPARVVRAAIVATAAYYTIVFLLLAAVRLVYPYEINWQEGNMLAMAARVLSGQRIYVAPTLEYIPFLYPPLFFYASAAMMKITGIGYVALRAVALLSTLALAALIYRQLRASGGSRWSGVVAVGLFLGFFSRATWDYDSGRVDLPAISLTFASLAVFLSPRAPSPARALLAGLVGSLAVLTKQTMIVFPACAAAHVFLANKERRGYSVAYFASTIALFAAMLWGLGLFEDGWFYYYIVKVPSGHHVRAWKLFVQGPAYLLLTMPVALGLGLAGPLLKKGSGFKLFADPWTVMLGLAVVAGLVMQAKDAGSFNHFIPAAAFAAFALGRFADAWINRSPRSALALVMFQLLMVFYPPTLVWPTRADREAGDRLIAALRAAPGDVYIPALPYYAVMAGKPWVAHYAAACDIFQFDTTLRDQLAAQIRAHRFAAVLPRVDVDLRDPGRCDVPGLSEFYRPADPVALPPMPTLGEIARGRPSLFALVHAGQVGPLWVPKASR